MCTNNLNTNDSLPLVFFKGIMLIKNMYQTQTDFIIIIIITKIIIIMQQSKESFKKF